MSGPGDIHDQVQRIVEETGGEIERDPSDVRRIKTKLVSWMNGGGSDFPSVLPQVTYLKANLCRLFEKYGMKIVLQVLKELEAELKANDWELPHYFHLDVAGSALNVAIE